VGLTIRRIVRPTLRGIAAMARNPRGFPHLERPSVIADNGRGEIRTKIELPSWNVLQDVTHPKPMTLNVRQVHSAGRSLATRGGGPEGAGEKLALT
jgi:hypothetical protein